MSRATSTPAKTFHAPLLIEWTEEKLATLEQEQLLNLLTNLDQQRAVGRVSEATADELQKRISAFLTKRTATKRAKAIG